MAPSQARATEYTTPPSVRPGDWHPRDGHAMLRGGGGDRAWLTRADRSTSPTSCAETASACTRPSRPTSTAELEAQGDGLSKLGSTRSLPVAIVLPTELTGGKQG